MMTFEFWYGLSVMVMLVMVEGLVLDRLERADVAVVSRFLKNSNSLLFHVGSVAWAVGMIMLVPHAFGFQFEFVGFFIGMAVYMAWAVRSSKPKWNRLKDRVIVARLEAEGKKGRRVADLRVRRITDFVPRWFMALPYAVLVATFIVYAFWVGNMEIYLGGWITPLFQLCVGLLVNGLMTHRMIELVLEPVDLRSDSPEEFSKRHHDFIRSRLRAMVIFQMTYAVAVVSMVVGFSRVFAPGQRHAPGFDWFLAGQVPFILGGIWIAVTTARGTARLEAERFQTAE